jgi:hypothetical protein
MSITHFLLQAGNEKFSDTVHQQYNSSIVCRNYKEINYVEISTSFFLEKPHTLTAGGDLVRKVPGDCVIIMRCDDVYPDPGALSAFTSTAFPTAGLLRTLAPTRS